MAEHYPIRPIRRAEFDALHAVGEHAFHDAAPTPHHRAQMLGRFELDRSLGAFDGPAPVGSAGAYTFQLCVPGALAAAAGVTWVSVLPTHRRRGILGSLMRHQLEDIHDRGEPVAVLWASEAGIYARYGYGRASWHATFTLHHGEGELMRGAPRDPRLRLRIAEPEAALAGLAKVYDSVLPGQPGLFARNSSWWQRVIDDPEEERHGASPLRCVLAEDDAGPRGYALYAGLSRWDAETFLPDSRLEVRELVAADPAATTALWSDLLSRDLVSEVSARLRPADDPLLQLLADPRRARPQVSDGLWVRVIDVPAALSLRRYSGPVDVVIEVTDDTCPWNQGRWRLTTSGAAPWTGHCQRTEDPADVDLPASSLGAAYLGGTRLGSLARAGLAAEVRPGALAALSAALSWEPAPWCPVIF